MSILYCIFLYIFVIRVFVKSSTKKNYFIAVTLVTLAMIATDLPYVIAGDQTLGEFFKYGGWQPFVAYAMALIWIFWGSFSFRKMRFKHNFKLKEEFISTSKGRTITYALISGFMLILGVILTVLYVFEVWDKITYIWVIPPYVIALLAFILVLKNLKSPKERFALLAWIDDDITVYSKEIDVAKFSYRQIVGELSKLYFIYEIAVIQVRGDISETIYAYILKIEKLEDFDFSAAGLKVTEDINPNLLIYLYENKKTKAKVRIEDGKVTAIK